MNLYETSQPRLAASVAAISDCLQRAVCRDHERLLARMFPEQSLGRKTDSSPSVLGPNEGGQR